VKIDIATSKRIVTERKKGANESGIDIKIIGIAHFSSTVGSRISNYELSETALNAMVIIGMIDQIGTMRTMINNSMGRLEGGCQFMINWGQAQCA
jgi:hypothetical protein